MTEYATSNEFQGIQVREEILNENSEVQWVEVIPQTGFLRLKQIIGDRPKRIPAIIPVSSSTWWDWVDKGKAPKPIKLSNNITVWRAEEIQKFILEQDSNRHH